MAIAYKVTRPALGKQWCIYRDPQTLADAELTDSEVGDVLHIEVAEMTEAELNALPEFEGW